MIKFTRAAGALRNWLGPFLFCLMLFSIHRLIVQNFLGFDLLVSWELRLKAIALGLASDVWASALLVFVVRLLPRFFLLPLLALFAFLLIPHVSYVEFFHVTLRYVHIKYLFDAGFITSSVDQLWSAGVLLQLIVSGLVGVAFIRASRGALAVRLVVRMVPAILGVVFGLFFNYVANTGLRANSFSPNMINNVLVGLGLDAVAHQRMAQLIKPDERDVALLSAQRKARTDSLASSTLFSREDLRNLLQEPSFAGKGIGDREDLEGRFLLTETRRQFTMETLRKQRRYVLVVLMESARGLESKLYHPETVGNMPFMDGVLSEGVTFLEGTSTGTVSRGGAEAVACDSLASVEFNAMRDTPWAKPLCAPEFLQSRLKRSGVGSRFVWMHGGHLSFDGQGLFWRRQGFEIPIDEQRMSASLPRTFWGLSDQVFFSHAADFLESDLKNDDDGLFFGVVTTISNHTRWSLPPDASPSQKSYADEVGFKHFASVRYADQAAHQFVMQLKRAGIWERSVVFFVGDHGMAEESELVPKYLAFGFNPEENMQMARALSGVYFGLSGGIVGQAISTCKRAGVCRSNEPLRWQHPVSQRDILATAAALVGEEESLSLFGVNVFRRERSVPVIADLGSHIFLKGEQTLVYSREDFFRAHHDESVDLAKAWYKLYLSYYLGGVSAADSGD